MSAIHDFIERLKAAGAHGDQVAHHEVLQAAPQRCAEVRRPWPGVIRGLLAARGVESLYAHQAQACDITRAGRHVVVATPTASGKSLCYALPVLESLIANPDAKALWLFPLKALAQDQLRAFRELTALLPEKTRPQAAIYDGDTPDHARRKLREDPPAVLLTNPEMLHLSLLPHHGTWAAFWAGLSHVVVDEVHTYRGVMGSHMAMVFRRLRRVARYYGSDPAFSFCSATIGNPGQLAELLTGLPAQVVDHSGAPQGQRHFLFIDPLESPATAAIRALRQALELGLKTIVYTASRKMTELIALWAEDKAGEYKGRISAYRAGFLPEERREIEARMASGELLAVVSTSALELGIDIGDLDVCILVGYPGTVMQTLQRGGRVGRKGQESAVVLVAGEDALDQYFVRHPEDFFRRPPESAVVNPENPVIVARHLECAAAELTLRLDEPMLEQPGLRREAQAMIGRAELLQSAEGAELYARRKRPQRDVDLRGAGGTFLIQEAGSGTVVGQVDEYRAYREAHQGAVYLHRGKPYVVENLDLPGRSATVRPERVGYYTRVRGEKSTEILQTYASRQVGSTTVHLGRLRVTQRITGYEKRRVADGKLLTIVPLELPDQVFETEGLWFEIPKATQEAAEAAMLHFMGGIHAMEHAAIAMMPLLVLADRNDLGGISIPFHPQVGSAAVFIYDGAPGGVGLARLGYAAAEDLLAATLRAVASCPCELGCPSCVHSPKCGSGNRPIAKDAAVFVLQSLSSGAAPGPARDRCLEILPPAPAPDTGANPNADAQGSAATLGWGMERPISGPIPRMTPVRFGVLDVETRRSSAEVGGWGNARAMGVSVAVLWDAGREEFARFGQDELPELVARLREMELIVGFNIARFDYAVLSGCVDFDFASLPTLDMLAEVKRRLGYRLTLDHLVKATLGAGKTACGLDALRWWQEGRLDLIGEYCQADVALTRDLYLHGRENGWLIFTNKAGAAVRLPVEW